MIEIGLMGRFRVCSDEEEVPNERFGGRLPRRLVRILAARGDQVVTRDALIEALWPRRPPADPDGNLNVLVNRARRALGDPAAIETASGGYHLGADLCRVDIDEFRRLLAEGRAEVDGGQPAACLRHLLVALERWAEPLPEDAYEDWAQPVRRALVADHQAALEMAADVALLVRQPVQAASLARRAVAAEPLRERAHLLLVRALAASGDRHAALEALGALRRTLADELGLDPSTEAARVEHQVLEGRGPDEAIGHPFEREDTPHRSFVGRRTELGGLLALHPAHDRVAVVEGVAGSGKSRLLEELARNTELPVLTARAFLPEATTPWALARAVLGEAMDHDLDALRRLPPATRQALSDLVVPDLVLPDVAVDGAERPVHLEHETRRVLALEGAVRMMSSVAAGGALLLVDDLQWADATSIELLALVIARVAELVVVLAHRPLHARDGIAESLARLLRAQPVRSFTLERLSLAELVDLTGDEGLARVLDQETDGTPFAVQEVLRHLSPTGSAEGDGRVRASESEGGSEHGAARQAAREGQRRSVLSRVDQQGPASRQLVHLLALLGREAPASVLARASERPTRAVVDDLDRLALAGLVRLGDRGWATGHDLITESVVEALRRPERGRLHALLADALTDEDTEPGERATHLLGAGDQRAGAAFARAAEEQLERHAHAEADRLAHQGLDVAREDAIRGDLLAVRAEVRMHDGDLPGARGDLRQALTHQRERTRRSRLLTRCGALAVATDDLVQADQLVDLALLDASDDPAARARALAMGSIIDMNRGDDGRAGRRTTEALTLFESLGDETGVADILDARAMATFLDGDIVAGVEAFDRVASLFHDSGNLLRVVTPRSTRGHGLVFLDRPAAGLGETEVALDLARTLGHPEGEAYALWHRSEAQVALDRVDEAMDSATESLGIAERVGHRGWTATALRAIGLAHEARGHDDGAGAAFHRSLEVGRPVPLFACWARARLALVHLRRGELDAAEQWADEAVADGPPLGQYEARLAQALVAVRRDCDDAPRRVADARRRAQEGGHLVSVRLLVDL